MGAELLWEVDLTDRATLNAPLLEGILDGREREFTVAAGGAVHRVQIEIQSRNKSVRSLRGMLGGDPENFFLLCRDDDGGTAAFFHPPGPASYILERRDGELQIVELEAESFSPCVGGLAPPEGLARTGAAAIPAPPVSIPPRGDRAVADDGSRHDLLIAWTSKTRTAAGGESQIQAEIQLAVDAANLVYDNSGIASNVRLVHSLETDYDESSAWQYGDYLYALAHPSDGKMDDLHPLRDRTGADFMVLIVENTDVLGNPMEGCGIGYLMADSLITPEFDIYAMSVVTRSCASSVWTLAHELGHNRGCHHNREDAGGGEGAYSYSFGHRFTGDDSNGYRTVMSYDTDPGGTFERIPYFSHPSISYQGQPTGVPVGDALEAHSALTHANTSTLCAGFRSEHTFVEFGWSGGSTGFIDAPFASIESGIEGSRVGGWLALRGDQPAFTGLLPADHRVYVHDGVGSTLFGSP
jgi:hypothetical protein